LFVYMFLTDFKKYAVFLNFFGGQKIPIAKIKGL
jgi:hypothetical protein